MEGQTMFGLKNTKDREIELQRENEMLKDKIACQAADIQYLSMMSGVDLDAGESEGDDSNVE